MGTFVSLRYFPGKCDQPNSISPCLPDKAILKKFSGHPHVMFSPRQLVQDPNETLLELKL
jgi:hypothetical protein